MRQAQSPSRRLGPAVGLAAAWIVWIPAAIALSSDEFAAESTAWNGLSALTEICVDVGVEVRVPLELKIVDLPAVDSLLLVHPVNRLPVDDLTAFLRRGGRVAIADDRGSGERLLRAFQIERAAVPDSATQARLRGNPGLLIAVPTGAHPLSQSVRAIGTNHPAAFRHSELEPVFTLGDRGPGLVLAGAVGTGRLIAVADSSVLINQMMVLDGNRQFARNLINYLRGDREGTMWLITPSARLVGSERPTWSAPTASLRTLLARMAKVELPPPLVILVTALLCLFALMLLLSNVQLRSPYRRMDALAGTPTPAGFSGRVDHFRRHSANLLVPLLTYKVEVEAELLRRIGIQHRLLLADVVTALEARGASAELTGRVRKLLLTLDAIATQEERGSESPEVDRQRFHDIVQSGERILADIARLE